MALCENLTPAYNAELAPAAARGLLSGSLVLITSLGNLWGSGMSRAYSTTTTNKGWMIPTAMQFIPAVGLLLLVPFTVESPRWLVLKGRKEAAKTSLDKVRPQRDVDSGATSAEIDALQLLIEESLENEKGSWLEIFKGNYLRRTWVSICLNTTRSNPWMVAKLAQIAATIFVIEQMNGNQFVQSYAATFYVQEGLGSKSFTYATVGQVVGVVGCVVAVLSFDITGRRPLFICGSVACAFFLYLAAGLGLKSNPNQNEVNTTIACFTLLAASTRISAGTICFLTGAEIGGVRMRKKIMVSPGIFSLELLSCCRALTSCETGLWNSLRRFGSLPSHLCYPLLTPSNGSEHRLDLWICGSLRRHLGLLLLPRTESEWM